MRLLLQGLLQLLKTGMFPPALRFHRDLVVMIACRSLLMGENPILPLPHC